MADRSELCGCDESLELRQKVRDLHNLIEDISRQRDVLGAENYAMRDFFKGWMKENMPEVYRGLYALFREE
jgi:hypothetical protein